MVTKIFDKQLKNNLELTGIPTAPTASPETNNNQIATTAYADAKVIDSITEDVTTIAPSQNAVFDALALKADVTSLEIEKKLLMDEIDSLKKSAIENSNAPYLTVSDYGDVTLAKNSVGVGTVGVDGVTVENLVVNGDFSDGTTGWSTTSGSISISGENLRLTVGTVEVVVVTNATGVAIPAVGSQIYINQIIKYISGSACTAIRCVLRGSTSTTEQIVVSTVLTPITDTLYILSGIATISAAITGNLIVAFRTEGVAQNNIFDISPVNMAICLNSHGLTSLTTAQLAKLLPVYFDGEQTFGGVGCLVSKDSAEVEVGRMYFETTPMYSLPSGLTDVIDQNILTKNIKKYTLQAEDINDINTSPSNNDIIYTISLDASFGVPTSINGLSYIGSAWPEKGYADSTANINTHFGTSNLQRIGFVVAKNTYASLAEAQASLAGTAVYYKLAEPYDTEVETNGQFLALSAGSVFYEPWYPDIAVYTDKFTLTKAITAVKELYKYGSETPITDAVIAGDGLSFTSASLTAGDLAYGVFEFNEPLRPLMTVKSRNDITTRVDTVTGTIYTFAPVITNGAIAPHGN